MIEKNIRAFFRVTALLVVTSVLCVSWFVGKFFIANKLRWQQSVFARWAAATARIANMKVEVRGQVPQPPFFLVSNHLGYMDIVAFSSTVKCFFVAKSEVADWFLLGRLVKTVGTVFIDRQNHRDLLRAAKEIAGKIEKGESLIIFPEGTSSQGEKVLPFKSSFLEIAAANNFLVSYASISYRSNDAMIKPGELICWWGDADFTLHLWRLFQVKKFTAIITFGDEKIKNSGRKALAAQLQAKVSENFIPVL